MWHTPKAWKVIPLTLVFLVALAQSDWCVLPNQEQTYRDLIKVGDVDWTFAPGKMPYAAAVINYGNYGEFKVFMQKGKEIATVAFGKLKAEQVSDAKFYTQCVFVMSGAHVVVAIVEPFKDSSLTSLLVFNLSGRDPSMPVFSLQPTYDLRLEVASTDQILLWQKDPSFYNNSISPLKYNYFLLTYDAALDRYSFDFLLRSLPPSQSDEGVILNNLAVQLYHSGDMKNAAKKLEDALLVANKGRGVIMDNSRYLERVRQVLMARQEASLDQPGTGFDDLKLDYLIGEYSLVLMSMQAGGQARRGERIALYGLSFAQVRDYDNLRKITKILTDGKYEGLPDYLVEVSRILFFHRDMEMLRAYLKLLESADPTHPSLAYLKSAVLADAGRLELAEQFLLTYLARTTVDESRLGECREYLYEIASILGDLDTANKMLAQLSRDTVWDLSTIAYLVNFSLALHTDLVSTTSSMGSRLKAPENPLDKLAFEEGSGTITTEGGEG
jgi:hypothetical protein